MTLFSRLCQVAFLQSLTSCPRHSFDPNTLKHALCNTSIGLYKSYIADCSYRWPQVIWHSRLAHYKSMGGNQVPQILVRSIQIAQNDDVCIRLRMTYPVQFCISNPLVGQLMLNDDVIRSIYASPYNFWLEWDRDIGWVPKCSSCQDASFGMWLGMWLLRSIHDRPWPWVTWGQKYQVTFPDHKVDESICLDEIKTMVAKSALYLK